MNNILKGISDYFQSADTTSKRFRNISYSEMIQDVIAKNQVPFLLVLGVAERKSPFREYLMSTAYKQLYDITIVICQDNKVLTNVLKGANPIFDLWSYTWSMIEADRTFGGVVDGIVEKDIESKLITLQRDSSYKLVYETELTVYKNIFIKTE